MVDIVGEQVGQVSAIVDRCGVGQARSQYPSTVEQNAAMVVVLARCVLILCVHRRGHRSVEMQRMDLTAVYHSNFKSSVLGV
jgi:hypothetical protein